jgi:predicted RNase H-like HicB family nuclease
MENEIGLDIIIEREEVAEETVFIASSPDINVFAEGKTIEIATRNFVEGAKSHLETFPEERNLLNKKIKKEMPMLTRVFL